MKEVNGSVRFGALVQMRGGDCPVSDLGVYAIMSGKNLVSLTWSVPPWAGLGTVDLHAGTQQGATDLGPVNGDGEKEGDPEYTVLGGGTNWVW